MQDLQTQLISKPLESINSNKLKDRIANRRYQICNATVNPYILSGILGNIYPHKSEINLKRIIKQILSNNNIKIIDIDRSTEQSEILSVIRELILILSNILDVCSKCLVVNSVFFKQGQHLCPVCSSPMLNYNKYYFKALRDVTIKMFNGTLIIFRISGTSSQNSINLYGNMNGSIHFKKSKGVHQICNFKQGKLHGNQKLISNNQLIISSCFNQGIIDGKFMSIIGGIRYTCNYVDGLRHGICLTIDINQPLLDQSNSIAIISQFDQYIGVVLKLCSYNKGKLNGLFIEKSFFNNIIETNYKDDVIDGIYLVYIIKNNIKVLLQRKHFINGVKHGIQEEWYETGIPRTYSIYNNGKLQGTFTQWDSEGQLAETIQYNEQGNKIKKIYEPNGFLSLMYKWVGNTLKVKKYNMQHKYEQVRTEFKFKGPQQSKFRYTEDITEITKIYNKNNIVIQKRTVNQQLYIVELFYDTGTPRSYQQFKQGMFYQKLDGIQKQWSIDGLLIEQRYFINGRQRTAQEYKDIQEKKQINFIN